jgi:SM-20-related protein
MTGIRKTSTCWLDYLDPKTDIENSLLMFLDAFRLQLCEALYCDLNFEDTEVLYARYPEKGFYRKHSDSHAPAVGVSDRDTERYLSIVLYVNDHPWQEKDGGSLRMFGDEYVPWASSIDVHPVPGTLLLFFSQGLSHEVLITSVKRYAVVGWFRIRATAHNTS